MIIKITKLYHFGNKKRFKVEESALYNFSLMVGQQLLEVEIEFSPLHQKQMVAP